MRHSRATPRLDLALPGGTRWLALAMWLAALPWLAPAAKADLLWGINGHPLVSYQGVTIEQQLDYVKDLGLRSYRVDVRDQRAAPRLARLVEAARGRGIEILPVLTPSFDLDRLSAEELYRLSRDMAAVLVGRFGSDIRVWELGNELENYAIIRGCEVRDNGEPYSCAWGPAGGDAALDYFGPRWAKVSAVLKGLSEGAKSAAPQVRRAMGTAGWGHTGAFERMQRDGIEWDISVWHMYGQDPEWALRVLARYGRPVWVTEFNHPGGSQGGEQQQADGLVLAMTRLRQLARRYRVEAAHIYELMDETYWAPNLEAYFGLVKLEKRSGGWAAGEAKPAYATVKRLVRDAPLFAFLERDCHDDPANRLSSAAGMQVAYAYCLALERSVDGAGVEYWSGRLAAGLPAPRLVAALLDSEEFRTRHAVGALGGRELAAVLHRVLLDREPSEAETALYMARQTAASDPLTDAAADIVGSAEFAARHPVLFVTHDADGAPIRSASERGTGKDAEGR